MNRIKDLINNMSLAWKIVILFFFFLVIWAIYSAVPRTAIQFFVLPEKVVLLLDKEDKQLVNNRDKIQVSTGKHTLTLFRDGYIPQTINVDVKNGKTTEVNIVLETIDGSAVQTNDEYLQQIAEGASEDVLNSKTELIEKLYPALPYLPIEGRYYSVNICLGDKYQHNMLKVSFCAYILDDSFKPMVIQALKDAGSKDADSYEYTWQYL